jgi:hypothetical protein
MIAFGVFAMLAPNREEYFGFLFKTVSDAFIAVEERHFKRRVVDQKHSGL